MTRYIDAELLKENFAKRLNNRFGITIKIDDAAVDLGLAIADTPAADVVEVNKISKRIIRKQSEVSDYWQKDVKQYRAMKGYSDIEHDTDNFLRGYNEAVEDMLAILDGERKDE